MKGKAVITTCVIVFLIALAFIVNVSRASLDDKFNAFFVICLFIGFTVLFIFIFNKSKESLSFYKNTANFIWNVETLCATTYGLYIFLEYTINDNTSHSLSDWTKENPILSSLVISIIITTAICRASISFVEILTQNVENDNNTPK